MAFTTVATAVTGQTYTAANYNTYVRDNFSAVWPYTTAGDISYATSASVIARLAAPSAEAITIHDGSAPSYIETAAADKYKVLMQNSAGNGVEFGGGLTYTQGVYDTTPYSYSTATERFVPNSIQNVTLQQTSTIIMVGHLVGYCDTAGKHGSFWVRANGVNYSTSAKLGSATLETVSLFGIFTGVPAGVRGFALREKPEFGGNAVNVDQWAYSIIVIPEF